MTDEENGALERIQNRDPAWADVAIVIRLLARERLEAESLYEALDALHTASDDE